jgi:hypothetical protein
MCDESLQGKRTFLLSIRQTQWEFCLTKQALENFNPKGITLAPLKRQHMLIWRFMLYIR